MPAPASQPTWATDATYTNGPATIPGTDTKVAPSAPVQAEGYIPQNKAYPQVMNWWKNLVGQWTTWLAAERDRLAPLIGGDDGLGEWAYPATRSRTVHLAPLGIASGWYSNVAGTSAGFQDLNDGWRPKEQALLGPPDVITPLGHVWTRTPGLYGVIPLPDTIPSGAQLTGVSFYVDPGSAQAVAGDRMVAALKSRAVTSGSGGAITTHGTDTTDSSDTAQILTLGLAVTVDRSARAYWLEILSSQGAGVASEDTLEGITVTFDDSGPRNG